MQGIILWCIEGTLLGRVSYVLNIVRYEYSFSVVHELQVLFDDVRVSKKQRQCSESMCRHVLDGQCSVNREWSSFATPSSMKCIVIIG